MRPIQSIRLITMLAAALAAAPGHAGLFCDDAVKFPADGNSFVVRDVRVFDSGKVIEHANVVVRAGRIRSVGPDKPPADLAVVDGAGRTLLSGPSEDITSLTAYGLAFHSQVLALVKAGMSTADALKATTEAAARVTPQDYRGRVAPGAFADLILVNGNPLSDINATRSIARAFKNGVEVRRSAGTIAAM
jgi:imidazolonepropionase-like amidohydrolase